MISCALGRSFVFTFAVLAATSFAWAQTWTGLGGNNLWTNTGNWDTAVPVSGNTATFNGAGNGNVSISLGAAARPIGSILFDSSAAAYSLGVLASGDQLNVDAGGIISSSGTVTTLQTVNAAVSGAGDLSLVNSSTSTGGLTFAGNVSNAGLLTLTNTISGSTLKVDGNISGATAMAVNATAGSVILNGTIATTGATTLSGAGLITLSNNITGGGSISSSATGTIAVSGANTYTGGTTFGTSSAQPFIRIGSSTVGAPGSITSGPFGTGTVTTNSSLPAVFQPIGADRTIANAFAMPGGLFFGTASAAVDPTGAHGITLSGPITTTGTRVLTNNLLNSVSNPAVLTLGSAASPSTISLGGTLTIQSQNSASGGGKTVINSVLADGSAASGFTVQNGASVTLTAANTYTGATNIQISSSTAVPSLYAMNTTGSATGPSGTVSIRTGTLGGTGSIGGLVSVLTSTNGAAHLAPGVNGPGKLTVGSVGFTGTSSCSGCFFDVEIGGTTAGTQYDQLAVGTTAIIGTSSTPRGTLNVGLINGFTTPTVDTDFTILTAGTSVTGVFATVNLPDPSWSIVYNPTSIVLHVTGTGVGLTGDFNSDGKVDAGDYATWRKANGTNNALANDGGLGVPIGPAHYNLWRQNFGNPPGAGSGLSRAAVPEPGSIALIVVGLAAMAFPRRGLFSRIV